MIRQGLVLQPKLVVADEPVSAVDVSMQSQVLNPLVDLKHDLKPLHPSELFGVRFMPAVTTS